MNRDFVILCGAAVVLGGLLGLVAASFRSKPRPSSLDLRHPDAPPDLDSFLQSYYLQPRPDLVADTIHALSVSGALKVPGAVAAYCRFLQ